MERPIEYIIKNNKKYDDSFYTNNNDIQLINAKSFLIDHIYPCEDVRKECEKWYHFSKLFYKGTSKEKEETN